LIKEFCTTDVNLVEMHIISIEAIIYFKDIYCHTPEKDNKYADTILI
jgi:hypothetical protein|tara:strand:+ start:531 stop:671 length:141 start_codon:yes stop_codon:yes gene_type:complete